MEPQVISPDLPEQPGMDYAGLRKEAVEFISKRAGDYWTNYNPHDPGITILELLCYAITDLSYRLEFDIRDILAEPADNGKEPQPQFFPARKILTSGPVTLDDYRKIIIDTEGVRNAWIETAEGPFNTRGYYRISIEPENEVNVSDNVLISKIKARLYASRNLCEDFLSIDILPPEIITVKADVSIESGMDATDILEEIRTRLSGFISPRVHLSTLEEIQSQGYPTEEIFEGPQLERGFIDEKNLAESVRKDRIFASDLIHLIRDIEGVSQVDNLRLSGKDGKEYTWGLNLTQGMTPRWAAGSGIRLFRRGIPCFIDEQSLADRLKTGQEKVENLPDENALDIPVPSGNYRNIDEYETIQNDLPQNYGVGHFGLPDNVSPRRKALANQLRAYLMLFDQVLANYLSQLAHTRDLFSPYSAAVSSYFSNLLPEDVESIITVKTGIQHENHTFLVKLLKLNGEDTADILEPMANIRTRREKLDGELQEMIETVRTAMKRKNRFLDHLLGRFAEEFPEASVLYHRPEITEAYLNVKQEFLKCYPQISSSRMKAMNYSFQEQVWDSENVSGLEQRIALKLGLTGFLRRKLNDQDREGFHLIEHLLLLPYTGDTGNKSVETGEQEDDYSFIVSILFPDWAGRFRNDSFRRYSEEVVREETPAHIVPNIRWCTRNTMKEYEAWYERWLPLKSSGSRSLPQPPENIRKLLGIRNKE
ncbi:MAG: hypothetical protein JW712_03385 [Dehalococcoidales bacterium]|nr:hypothetical protein [Dehalococcoidales bacterium]